MIQLHDKSQNSIRLQNANYMESIDLTALDSYSLSDLDTYYHNCHLKFDFILDFINLTYKNKKVLFLEREFVIQRCFCRLRVGLLFRIKSLGRPVQIINCGIEKVVFI